MIAGTTAQDAQLEDVEALRLETAPETRNYRHFVRRVWELQRAGFQGAVADAIERGVEPETARREAAQAIRGDLRALMSELLTRAPTPAILDFLAVARTWGDAGEDLFDGHQRAVVALIESAYPTPTWTELAPLDHVAAEDEQAWAAWSATWGATLAVSDPEAAAFFQRVAKEAKASSELSTEATPKRRWAPWIVAAAVAGLGVTALVVFARRRGRERRPPPMPEWSVQAFGGAPRAHQGMSGRASRGAEAESRKGRERPMKIFDGVQIQPTFGPMLQNILAIASILGGTLIEADRHRKERLAE
ncbi:MAG: hypothetical protein KC420_16925, partial [Myxococcales bacterium]|nr:hypothetical protein [Myxococcales bacterium]